MGNKRYIAMGVLLVLVLLLSGCGNRAGNHGGAEPEPGINPGSSIEVEPDAESNPGSSADAEPDTASDPGNSADTEPDIGSDPGSSTDIEPDTGKTISTMEKLLRTSILPVGTTMYVWGGGWNEEDTGSGIESVTIGLSPRWAEFAAGQSAAYNHNATRYQIHDGLDCSGYIGWLVYNTFHTVSGEAGYVGKAYAMAENFASYGWGDYLPAGTAANSWKAGDICSMKGHVWMCLGTCGDGSVLLIHSSPPGVRICGTRLKDGSDSQAIALAEKCMSTQYPDWYRRYSDCAVNHSYLESSSRMRWNSSTLTDAESYQKMSAEELAGILFP